MSTKSKDVGDAILHGIDSLEERAHDTVQSGAAGARHLTRNSARWAGRQERVAASKMRLLKKQALQARRTAGDSIAAAGEQATEIISATNSYVHQKPWTAITIAAGSALLLGAFLGRRR